MRSVAHMVWFGLIKGILMEKLIVALGFIICTLAVIWLFLPTKKQYRKWTLPSKISYLAGVIAFLGLPAIGLTYYKELTSTPLEKYSFTPEVRFDGTNEFTKIYSRLFRKYRWDSYQLPLPQGLDRTVTVGDCPSNDCTKIRIASDASEDQKTRLVITFDSANLFDLANDGTSGTFGILTTGTGDDKHEIVVQVDPRLFTHSAGVIGSTLLFSEGEAFLLCLPTHDYLVHVVDDSINSPKIQIDVKSSTFNSEKQCDFIKYFDSHYYISSTTTSSRT